MNIKLFKIFLGIPLIYMVILLVFMFTIFSQIESGKGLDDEIFTIIFPLHLFSMFCIFYCLYFNAKALKSVELQKPVVFSEFAGEFVLIWMLPIGIWFIQPRLNKLFDSKIIADEKI